MDRQLSIDFDRARQLGLIKDWCPDTEDSVKGGTLKGVLSQINHYGRGRVCFVSQARLCRECGIGERTCRRAISVLQKLGVLITVRTKVAEDSRMTRNNYRIVWSELEVIVQRQKRIQSALASKLPNQSVSCADPTVSCAVQRATSVDSQLELGVIDDGQGRYQSALDPRFVGQSVSCADPTVSCAVQRATSVDRQTGNYPCDPPSDQPAMGQYQPAIVSDQPAMVSDQPAMVSDQQAMVAAIDCITRRETKNYTAPKAPRVALDSGGRMAADFRTELFDTGRATVHVRGRHPPPPRSGPGEPQTEIERLFAEAGIELWARCAAEFGHLGPEAIRNAIATYRANRAKLKGPQAIVFALRSGAWPAKGMAPLKPPDPPEVTEARQLRQRQRRLEQLREGERHQIILAGRRAKLSDSEIGKRLVAAGLDPEGFLSDEFLEDQT